MYMYMTSFFLGYDVASISSPPSLIAAKHGTFVGPEYLVDLGVGRYL